MTDHSLGMNSTSAASEHEHYEVAMALASAYGIIYLVDINSGKFSKYSESKRLEKLGISDHGDNFYNVVKEVAKKAIHPDDRELLISSTRHDSLINNLQKNGSVSITYRQMTAQGEIYLNLIALLPKNDAEHFIVAIRNVDSQVRHKMKIENEKNTFNHIIAALARRYEVIYYVNAETSEYTEYSSSEKYSKLNIGETGKDFFADSQKNMKRDIYYEDYQMMSEALNKDAFLKRLGTSGMFTLNYRLMLDNRPQYVALYAVRPKDDVKHFIVAIANIDTVTRREIAITKALGNAIDVANRDALTGVKSKHAYMQTAEDIDSMIQKDKKPEFAIVIADVNGLKYINDNFGHSVGDDYIKEACHIVCTIFKHSPVFRIGGDGFAVLLMGQDFDLRDSLLLDLHRSAENNNKNGKVTVSGGLAVFEPDTDTNFDDVFKRADMEMYKFKHRFKSAQKCQQC